MDLKRLADEYLRDADRERFRQATGTDVDGLLRISGQWVQASIDSVGAERTFVRAFMSNCALYAHELNAYGLHVLRALMWSRLYDSQRQARGSHRHPMWHAFSRDGILIVPRFNANLMRNQRSIAKPVLELLRMVSGLTHVPAQWKDYATLTHVSGDPQFYMHVDTLHPTWKVFVFAGGTERASGPFHYVNGSHGAHATGKLRWLFERTRAHTRVVAAQQQGSGLAYTMEEAASSQGSASMLHRGSAQERWKPPPISGAYADATHSAGVVPAAIRVVGFDPALPPASAAATSLLAPYNLPAPQPVLVPRGAPPTLVIADTSGLHFRGFAPPGTRRLSATIDGIGGGCRGCIPRVNVFKCVLDGVDC